MEQSRPFIKTLNLDVFDFFNKTFGHPSLDWLILLIQDICNPDHVLYYTFIIAIMGASLLYLNRKDKEQFKKTFILGISSVICFCIAVIGLYLIVIIKGYASVHRPFCSHHGAYAIKEIIKSLQCTQSFPSGHMGFSIVIVASFWPLFNKFFKFIAVTFIAIVAIARMATAAHYPMDLLGAIIIMLPLTLYVRHMVLNFVNSHEKHSNAIIDKIWPLFVPSK